jgi:hypothetical protein
MTFLANADCPVSGEFPRVIAHRNPNGYKVAGAEILPTEQ